jgi:diguanylate cyclase (GGDEF)-like protein
MLLASGCLASLWALVVAVGLPGPDVQWRGAIVAVSAIAAGFGVVLLLLGRRTPVWLLYAFPSVAALLICVPPLASRESMGPILLIWPVLFAGYLLPERIAVLSLGVSLAVLVAVALRIHTNDTVASDLIIGTSLIATLYITVHLRRHNRTLFHALQREARTDPLTGLANRRAFDDFLDRECALYERHGDPLALLALDIDHFKKLNDRAGHPAGDAALAALADALTAQVRRGDIVARTGGEEFAILLTDCPTPEAQNRARDLVAFVAAESSHWANPITVSIGIATIPHHAGTAIQLVAAADTALYDAKAAGRNTTATAAATSAADA